MIERVVEPSRIRRGRMATSPVWLVRRATGESGRFQTRMHAAAFDADGCTHGHEKRIGTWCTVCRGHISGADALGSHSSGGAGTGRLRQRTRPGHQGAPWEGEVMDATKLADGSSWPIDVEALQELAHRLRYQENDYHAACVVGAYLYLLTSSTRTQREKLRLIREAWAEAPRGRAPGKGGGR